VPNSFEENVCKNANTLAHVVEHLVVLATLRRRWSLSGREGLGSFTPMSRLGGDVTWCFRGVKMIIFLYANVETWRRCHMVFHELKLML
jgi:uncharacterized protein YaaW (UPF0174 family)